MERKRLEAVFVWSTNNPSLSTLDVLTAIEQTTKEVLNQLKTSVSEGWSLVDDSYSVTLLPLGSGGTVDYDHVIRIVCRVWVERGT